MKAIFFSPHDDDVNFVCGGTITKLTKRGDEVIIFVARECNGIRLKEEKKALRIIGVNSSIIANLRFDSLSEMAEIALLTDYIKRFKPDKVYIPYIYDSNQHHRRLAKYCLSALRRTDIDVYMYDTPTVKGVTIEKFVPNVYEDISKEFKTKIEACMCHESQLKRLGYDYVKRYLKDKDAHNGYLAGVKYAEVFKIIKEVRR